MFRESLFGDFVQKTVEMAHGFRRIRCFGQKARELLDHGNGHPQLFLILAVLDLAAPAIGDEELIPHFTGNTSDLHLVDVNALHCEGIRNCVEKTEDVCGMRFNHSPLRRKLIVEANLDWREQAA